MLKIESIKLKAKSLYSYVNEIIGKRAYIREQIKSTKSSIAKMEADIADYEMAVLLLEFVTKARQKQVVSLFEHTISAALKDIFDDSYQFRFVFGKRGNLMTCDYEMKNSEFPHWHNIKYAHGQSVSQIIAMILRILLVKLDSELDDVIVLDEPLSGLEPDREIVAAKFLQNITEKFVMQVIMVTQSRRFAACADKQLEI